MPTRPPPYFVGQYTPPARDAYELAAEEAAAAAAHRAAQELGSQPLASVVFASARLPTEHFPPSSQFLIISILTMWEVDRLIDVLRVTDQGYPMIAQWWVLHRQTMARNPHIEVGPWDPEAWTRDRPAAARAMQTYFYLQIFRYDKLEVIASTNQSYEFMGLNMRRYSSVRPAGSTVTHERFARLLAYYGQELQSMPPMDWAGDDTEYEEDTVATEADLETLEWAPDSD
jgi:hypothetical protein